MLLLSVILSAALFVIALSSTKSISDIAKENITNVYGDADAILTSSEQSKLPFIDDDIKLNKKRSNPIKCDITILNGSEDTLTFQELNGWKLHSSKNTRIITFEGNHFFINSNMKRIINLIETTLL